MTDSKLYVGCEIRLTHASATDDFASFLKVHFAWEIARDARSFKQAVLRLVRKELPPRHGRPNDPRLHEAARMVWEEGKTVKDVLRAQLSGFDRLDTYGRYLAEKGLRAALARRRRLRPSLESRLGRLPTKEIRGAPGSREFKRPRLYQLGVYSMR